MYVCTSYTAVNCVYSLCVFVCRCVCVTDCLSVLSPLQCEQWLQTYTQQTPPPLSRPAPRLERASKVALRKGRVNMLLPPFIHPSILPAVEHKTNTPHHRSACRASVYPSICLSFIPRSRHAIPSHALLHSFPSSGSMAVIPPSPSFDPPPPPHFILKLLRLHKKSEIKHTPVNAASPAASSLPPCHVTTDLPQLIYSEGFVCSDWLLLSCSRFLVQFVRGFFLLFVRSSVNV